MSQSVNSYSQIRIILLVIACYVIWVAVDSASKPAGAESASRIDKTVAKICNETNKHLPYMINSETRLESTSPGIGKTICFQYTLIHLKKAENRDHSRNFSRMREANINKYRTDKALKAVRDLGLVVRHKYYDQAGNFLTEYEVGPKDLR